MAPISGQDPESGDSAGLFPNRGIAFFAHLLTVPRQLDRWVHNAPSLLNVAPSMVRLVQEASDLDNDCKSKPA
jgi:hypothetical protein